MKTEVYTCDICKQSKSQMDLSNIEIKTAGIIIKDRNHYHPLRIDICSDCLKRKGFIVEVKDNEDIQQVKNQNEKTLETKLYELLEDMGVVFGE